MKILILRFGQAVYISKLILVENESYIKIYFFFCFTVGVACNGDSGGGFHVFIPDNMGDNSTTGMWHIRGIISMSVPTMDSAICSTDHYTVFTDVDKYREWISYNIK